MTTMMQAVIDSGTGYPVRARGFTAPAAGKTGTSHDAWFAGYTSNLLCIVWVGNDDYTDIKLAGGTTAAPIWAEFMKRAQKIPQYSDMKGFPAPSGVVASPDRQGHQPAGDAIVSADLLRGLHRRNRAQGDLRAGLHRPSRTFLQDPRTGLAPGAHRPRPPMGRCRPADGPPAPARTAATQAAGQQPGEQKKKKGFFSRVFGGKGSDKRPESTIAETRPPEKGNKPPPE